MRTILHLDLDAFFCAVEEHYTPELKGVPFAVGGQPDQRGVVASCSYPARAFGVRSAMPMSRAVQLCPELVIVRHRFDGYHKASRQVMDYLNSITPLVEQLSIDEAFLDVTGVKGNVAAEIQAHINMAFDLPCSLGVATNKLIAKIANNIGKSEHKNYDEPPNAIKVIPNGGEAAFLAPLDIRELWGVGPKTAEKLHRMGVRTIGDLAKQSQKNLIRQFGKLGGELYWRSKGIDQRPVQPEQETKSISKEITFSKDVTDADKLQRTIRSMCDDIGWRLRHDGLRGQTVRIKLRWSDFTTLTRQTTFDQPVDSDSVIYEAALNLFTRNWPRGKPVRLIGVGISGFDTNARQMSLFEAMDGEKKKSNEQEQKLQSALDTLKDRFGERTIRRGSTFKRDDG